MPVHWNGIQDTDHPAWDPNHIASIDCTVCHGDIRGAGLGHLLCDPPMQDPPMRPTNKENIPARRRACGNCGRLGHLSTTCIAPAKAHDKIGVEVEGWWRDLPAVEQVAANWHMSGAHDGSLARDRTGETQPYEFRTRPGSLGETISQVTAIYPDKCDKSAGMHVHMSFADTMDVTSLATPQFLAYFKERWNAWGTRVGVHPDSDFWSRLRGENLDYCAVTSFENIRVSPTRAGRYYQLNFSSWERHRTMEMRMLPLFRDARLAVLALEEWVSIVEDFIQHVAPSVWAAFDRAAAVEVTEAPAALVDEVQLDLVQLERTRDIGVLTPLERTENEAFMVGTLPATRDISREIPLPAIAPPTPGHVRLFGGPSAAVNRVRQLIQQGAY